VSGQRLQVGHAGGDHDREVGIRVLHLVEHLVVAIVGVDRHDAAAERVQREVVEEELRAVLEQERDPVAVTEPGVPVGGAEALDLGARGSVRELHPLGVIGAAGCRRRAQECVIACHRRGGAERLVHAGHGAP
jgi:hypothetical protein